MVERAQRRGGVPPADRKAAQAAAAALAQTLFACSDFLESEVEAGSLDTITCLRWACVGGLRHRAARLLLLLLLR